MVKMGSTGHIQHCGEGYRFTSPAGCANRTLEDMNFAKKYCEEKGILYYWVPCRTLIKGKKNAKANQ